MANDKVRLQGFIHALEQARFLRFLRIPLAVVLALTLASLYLLVQFRGLSDGDGIDQAQVARELARGNGFSTKVVRPAAAHLLEQTGVSVQNVPELYHAPLHPIVNALPLRLLLGLSGQKMDSANPVYVFDRVIAAVAVLFFLLGVSIHFLIVRTLFDARIAWLTTGITLLADQFWQYSLSGLPQMLLFLLFSLLFYCVLRAIQAAREQRFTLVWLLLGGLLAGMLALAHPLTLWMSAGLWAFCARFFRPRLLAATLPLIFCLSLFGIWVWYTYRVSHTWLGVSPYGLLDGVLFTEHGWLSQVQPDLSQLHPAVFRGRFFQNYRELFGGIYLAWGGIFTAPLFFVALLHVFRHPEVNDFKGALLCAWLGSLGAALLIGKGDKDLSINQLQILFGPLFAGYGFAILLVLWQRSGFTWVGYRYGLYGLTYLVTALPLCFSFLTSGPRIQFPPYLPPVMQAFNDWTTPDEILVSDMPGAVAWYSDRKALWLPAKMSDFFTYHDYQSLGGSIVGLYLTPISRDQGYSSRVATGEYREWTRLMIPLPQAINGFPFKYLLNCDSNQQCLLYMDRPRWTDKSH